MMQCPECKEEVAEYEEVNTAKLWTARDVVEGLTAWGPYDAEKELLHISGQLAHIRFDDGTSRLVRMLRA